MPDLRALIICCILLVVFGGCGKRTEIVLPSDEVLIELLYDLHLAEASLTRVGVGIQDSIALEIRKRIAATHQITPELMDVWLETLQRSPERLSTLYDSLIVRFEKAATPAE